MSATSLLIYMQFHQITVNFQNALQVAEANCWNGITPCRLAAQIVSIARSNLTAS